MEKREKGGEIIVPEEPLLKGKALVKAGTEYATAIFVQKPRNIDAIVEAVKRECQFAGEKFYYGWKFERGKSAGKTVEGGSIGLATSLARLWGNVAIPVIVEETLDRWMFTPTFIDLETGFNIQRVFRFDRAAELPGEYDVVRKEDMKFQIAQSKAIRNVILNGGIPRWLVDSAVKWAKQAVISNINKEGLAKATEQALKFFEKYGIKEKDLIGYLGQPKANWTAEQIAYLRGIAQRLKDEEITVEEILAEMAEVQQQQAVTVDEILKGKGKGAKPAKSGGKKKEPASKKKAKTFPCENPECQAEVPEDKVKYSEEEFNGAIFCTKCQVLARSGKLAIPK